MSVMRMFVWMGVFLEQPWGRGGLAGTETAEKQEGELAAVQARNAELQGAVERAQAELGSQADALAEMREQLAVAQAAMSAKDEDIAEGRQQVAELEAAKVATAEGHVAEMGRLEEQRQAAVAAVEAEKDDLTARLQELRRLPLPPSKPPLPFPSSIAHHSTPFPR